MPTCKTCRFWVITANYPLLDYLMKDPENRRHCSQKRVIKNAFNEDVEIWYTAHFHEACELYQERAQLTIEF